MTNIPSNKGKSFIRAEISEKQKEYIRLLAELTQELLGQVVERFIDRNLQLIQDYNNELDALNSISRRRIDMNT